MYPQERTAVLQIVSILVFNALGIGCVAALKHVPPLVCPLIRPLLTPFLMENLFLPSRPTRAWPLALSRAVQTGSMWVPRTQGDFIKIVDPSSAAVHPNTIPT
ncbi:hypothetical protein FB451DRAFT_1211332 [Mycena latifolia]|nr:hypothetical protein FB451DRAFT_1211332 [Mycena latifolia]